MGPSLGSARILTKKVGSARAIFQKARIEKIGKNEPIWGLFKNTIYKTLILTKKINSFLYNSPRGPFSLKKLGINGQI